MGVSIGKRRLRKLQQSEKSVKPSVKTQLVTKKYTLLAGKETLFLSFRLLCCSLNWFNKKDLRSDRLHPLLFLFEVMQSLFDRSFASSVVNSTLACNIFDVPFVKKRPSTLSFVAGQPLGDYSSWPLFALSHRVDLCRRGLPWFPLH